MPEGRRKVDLANSDLYWSVRCAQCGTLNQLASVAFDGYGIARVPWTLEPFECVCKLCQGVETYKRDQVVIAVGPVTPRAFRSHPSFVDLDGRGRAR